MAPLTISLVDDRDQVGRTRLEFHITVVKVTIHFPGLSRDRHVREPINATTIGPRTLTAHKHFHIAKSFTFDIRDRSIDRSPQVPNPVVVSSTCW